MERTLHRLVYYSRNRVAGDVAKLSAAIDAILVASQRNNSACGVTGALMFNAGCFGQVLEGPREVLESTFERIQRDERHGDVSLLAFEPITVRTFGHWSMGFAGMRPDHVKTFAHVGAGSGFDLSKATGDKLLQALQVLAIADESAEA